MLPETNGCGRAATRRIEAYRQSTDGTTLDGSVYTCGVHFEPAMTAFRGAGFQPHSMPVEPVPGVEIVPKRCGDGLDFTGIAIRVLTAPERVSGDEVTHPDWCTREEQHGDVAVHLSTPVQVNPGGDPLYILTLEQSYRADAPIVLFGVFEDDDHQSHGLPLPVARGLLVKLRTVLRTAGAQ